MKLLLVALLAGIVGFLFTDRALSYIFAEKTQVCLRSEEKTCWSDQYGITYRCRTCVEWGRR